MTPFATKQTLKELSGYKRPTAIARWLDGNGYPYEKDRKGWPRVYQSVIDSRLGGEDKIASPSEPRLRL